ncbi:MAG: stage 0 sporulation protein [Candidatus Omnitrophica bacterium]|nr:stage 0 sporulation protein [Candidatus Omnitrophota bacterium]
MEKIIEVKLGEYRSVAFFEENQIVCDKNDHVILEVDRGFEFGRVVALVDESVKIKPSSIKGNIVRVATEGDMNQIKNNRMKAQEALGICVRKITERKLNMRLVKTEYTFDSSKIIFSFTAEGRIDFRALVKDLARIFRVRIELKQIGVRDKAKIIGGYGVCGREQCCSSYIHFFQPLSIKMAKEQALPLNPSRISGSCGRIKCCMAYEYEVYKEQGRTLPRLGDKINTPDGKGKIIDLNILRRYAYVELNEGKLVKIEFPSKDEEKKEAREAPVTEEGNKNPAIE